MNRLAFLCVSSALLACATAKSVRKPLPQTPPSVVALPYEEWPKPFTTPRTPDEARKRRQALEQRPPDRRFLLAFGDIAALMGQQPGGAAEARLVDGRWLIVYRNQVIGEAGPFADYGELTTVLVRWAAEVAGESKQLVTPPSEAVLLDEAAVSETTAVNAAWEKGDRSSTIIARAAHLLTSMAFDTYDTVEVADNLYGRAWAFAALAQARGVRSASDEALLAFALGYKRAAEALAPKAEDEAVRALVLNDRKRLAALVRENPASASFRYLQLRALIGADRREELMREVSAIGRRMPDSTMGVLARSGVFELMSRYPMQSAANTVMALEARTAAGATSEHPAEPSILVAMESALKALPVHQGVPVDTAVEQSAIRARVFSGLDAAMKFRLNSRGVVSEGEQLLEMMGAADGVAGDFQDWMSIRVQLEKGINPGLLQAALLGHWGRLGAVTVGRIVLDRKFEADRGSAQGVDAARYFIRRADSRPSHRKMMLNVSSELMYDPGFSYRATSRWADVSGDVWSVTWLRSANGDWAGLEQIAADSAVAMTERFAAVEKLFAAKQLSLEETARRYKALSSLQDGATIRSSYEAFLAHHDLSADQIELLSPWVVAHPDDHSLAAAWIRSDLSRAYRLQGRHDEAWKTVKPAMETGSASSLFQGALALLALGKKQEAFEVGRRLSKRYDTDTAQLDLAGLYWRSGMPAEAAQHLKGKLSTDAWYNTAPKWFLPCFDEHPTDVEAAFDALLAVESAWNLFGFARGLAEKNRADLAVMLALKLRESFPTLNIQIYTWLRKLKGDAEAEKWFWARTTPRQFVDIAQNTLEDGADGLLFSVPDAPLKPAENEALWQLRAMSLAMSRTTKGPQFDSVRRHYESATAPSPDGTFELLLSRFLMGLEKQDAVLAMATTPRRMTRASINLAFAEERDGHVIEAMERYLDTIDLRPQYGDEDWALDRLKVWDATGKSPARLAAE